MSLVSHSPSATTAVIPPSIAAQFHQSSTVWRPTPPADHRGSAPRLIARGGPWQTWLAQAELREQQSRAAQVVELERLNRLGRLANTD